MAGTFSGYKLQGKIIFQGLPISIENERGSVRRGEDAEGKEWATFMHYPYGYIRATEGTDGDHVDCYIGPNHNSVMVFIIHQQDPVTKQYDEDKCMLGFSSAPEAKEAYLRQYNKSGFYQSMTIVTISAFKDMLKLRYGLKLKGNKDRKLVIQNKQKQAGLLPENADVILKDDV